MSTPEDVFRRMLELLRAKDLDGMAELWAEDAVSEFPFAAAGAPTRVEGRAAMREYLASFVHLVDVAEIPSLSILRTTDPDTIVVEFTARGTTVATGDPYRMTYIVVITARDGRFVRYRDYWSPVGAALALGRLPELLGALGGEVG